MLLADRARATLKEEEIQTKCPQNKYTYYTHKCTHIESVRNIKCLEVFMCISTETQDFICANINIFFNTKNKLVKLYFKICFHFDIFLQHCQWSSAVNNKTLKSKGVKTFNRHCAKRAHRPWCSTYPINADLGIWVAGCQVFFRRWSGALGGVSIAHTLKSTLRFFPTIHIFALKGTIHCAAWTLTGTAREKFWKINTSLHLMKNVLT